MRSLIHARRRWLRRPLRLAQLVAVCLMAGCAADPGGDGPTASPPACAYGSGDPVALTRRDRRFLVPARVAGGLALMQPDTGAQSSGVTPATAQRLGLRPEPGQQSLIMGVGGVTQGGRTTAQMELGATTLGPIRLAIVPLPSFSAQPPDGLLGADLLGRFDIDLDLEARRLTLHPQPARCVLTAPPWPHAARVLPVERRGGRFLLDVQIEGQTVRALLDTGADRSLLTETAARRLGVSEARLAAAPPGRGRGVDGRDRESRLVRFADVRIGGEVLRDVPISVGGGLLAREYEMLLGLDWARRRRLWISYATGQVFFAPAAAGVVFATE